VPGAAANNYLLQALQQMYRITKPGSNVYLISDFVNFDGNCARLVQQLALHNSMTCVLIYDGLEENLPRPGVYGITDGQARSTIDTFTRSVREHYHEDFDQRIKTLADTLSKIQVHLITVRTNEVVMDQLETWKQKTH
jgi:hypothetical protein